MTLDKPRRAIGDVDLGRFCSRGTSTTPCIPFSVLELAINKQGEFLTFHVQVGYVKHLQRRPVHCDELQKKLPLDMSNVCCPSDECFTTRVSVSTFTRSAGLKAHRQYVEVPLTVRHRSLRLNWARGHYRWSRRRWNRVLFTDESLFNVQFADGRLQIWRRTGESMDENNIVERDRYDGGSEMIWGGLVCHSGKTDLVTVNGRRYCDEIVIPVVIPVL